MLSRDILCVSNAIILCGACFWDTNKMWVKHSDAVSSQFMLMVNKIYIKTVCVISRYIFCYESTIHEISFGILIVYNVCKARFFIKY